MSRATGYRLRATGLGLLVAAACTPGRSATATASAASTANPLPDPAPRAAEGAARSSPGVRAKSGVEFVAFAGGESLDGFVMKELRRAEKDRKTLLLYVGAEWCEPCQRFHAAAQRGELDRAFPDLRLVDLDRDRDEAELRQTSCLSPMIPMFAKPTPRGNCSEKMINGGIKGEGAVDNIVPRLEKLLAQP